MHLLSIIRTRFSRDAVFAIIIILLSAALLVMPDLFDSPYVQNVPRARAQVLTVDNSLLQQYGIIKAGSQMLTVKVLDGAYAGKEAKATNNLIGKMETDKLFRPGDTVYLVLDRVDGDNVIQTTAYDHYRLDIEALLVVIFAALLVGFAGWSGLRALVSFAFAIILLWKILFPAILMGLDPVWIALGVVTLITSATLSLVAGVNRVALVALLGSLLGIVLTITMSLILLPGFHLHGAVLPFSETLLYSGFEFLDLTRLFLAAIFIGASGAVLDVAIDVSTAMSEVSQKRPDLSRKDLIRSGFVVGRNMTSTMVTTLLMAYVSGYMALLMVFLAQGVPPVNILNTNYVAAEIVKTVVGSFGLVTVAPLTAVIGGFIYMDKRRKTVPVVAATDAVTFKIDASQCDLHIGDSVTPDTVIGRDFATGEVVNARCHGRVMNIGFHGADHALVIVIQPSS